MGSPFMGGTAKCRTIFLRAKRRLTSLIQGAVWNFASRTYADCPFGWSGVYRPYRLCLNYVLELVAALGDSHVCRAYHQPTTLIGHLNKQRRQGVWGADDLPIGLCVHHDADVSFHLKGAVPAAISTVQTVLTIWKFPPSYHPLVVRRQ